MLYRLVLADCFDWLARQPAQSIHGVVTDPPYGVIEFSEREREILRNGERGGVWRLPPAFDGSTRDPLPRFTVLTDKEKTRLREYMRDWGRALMPALVPGAHAIVAGNPMLQYLVQTGMAEAGFEVRSAILRLYVGLRGGDRPKLAESEFPDVCVTPRGGYEPWMVFRKPLGEKTVAQNLRRWSTGGLRRLADERPLPDAIPSARTPEVETALCSHPTMKPQHMLRILVRAVLPLGEGTVLDTFAGSGSTLAAATAVGYRSIGVEVDPHYYHEAQRVIPLLARVYPDFRGERLELGEAGVPSARRPKASPRQSPQRSLL
jgi:DNA modification methylase